MFEIEKKRQARKFFRINLDKHQNFKWRFQFFFYLQPFKTYSQFSLVKLLLIIYLIYFKYKK